MKAYVTVLILSIMFLFGVLCSSVHQANATGYQRDYFPTGPAVVPWNYYIPNPYVYGQPYFYGPPVFVPRPYFTPRPFYRVPRPYFRRYRY